MFRAKVKGFGSSAIRRDVLSELGAAEKGIDRENIPSETLRRGEATNG